MSDLMERITSLCKRRGFVYQTGSLYGGLRGFWDYGPLGAQLRKNIRDQWWKDIVTCSPIDTKHQKPLTILPFEGSIITNPKVWDASGFLRHFYTTFIHCPSCERDNSIESWETDDKCPYCGKLLEDINNLEEQTKHRSRLISVEEIFADSQGSKLYLRPESSQNIFTNFNNIIQTNRVKLPFGIAQIGKVFVNDIAPRKFFFRSKEFEQMEMEFFIDPEDDVNKWFLFWADNRMSWWLDNGLSEDKLSIYAYSQNELSYNAKSSNGVVSIMYEFPFGKYEIEHIIHRGKFDLSLHSQASGTELSFFDAKTKSTIIPHVIECSTSLEKGLLAILCESYHVDNERPCKEFMNIPVRLAPIKVAFCPMENKGVLSNIAFSLFNHYRRNFNCSLEVKGSIGKRYARMDEIGTPFCVTVDRETRKDNSVTIRFLKTMEQTRVSLEMLDVFFHRNLN